MYSKMYKTIKKTPKGAFFMLQEILCICRLAHEASYLFGGLRRVMDVFHHILYRDPVAHQRIYGGIVICDIIAITHGNFQHPHAGGANALS